MLLTPTPTTTPTTSTSSLISPDLYVGIAIFAIVLQFIFAIFVIMSSHPHYTVSVPNPVQPFADRLGIPWKWAQYFKLTSAFILFALLLYIASKTQKPIIVGSLLGTIPPILIELNDLWRSPNVVCNGIKITRYPKSWHTFGDWRADEEANNILRVQGKFKNEGRGKAENCQIKFGSDLVDNQTYDTRWSDQKRLVEDISPDESKMLDIFWMNLEDTGIYTTKPTQEIGDKHHPPGSYEMIQRPELSTGTHSFHVDINAERMNQRSESLSDLKEIDIPDDLLDMAGDWEVVETIKQVGEDYVIYYNINKEKVIEVPRWFDLTILDEIGRFSRDEISAKQGETYEEALDRKYTIKRPD